MRFSSYGSLALLLMAMLAGCGGDSDAVADTGASSPSGPVSDSPPEEPSNPASLECGAAEFPCSLFEVSVDVLKRGEQLAEAVIGMLDGGIPVDAALAFLLSQPDMADCAGNSAAIRFRLKGGRDVFILQPTPPGSMAPESAPPVAMKSGTSSQKVVVGQGEENKRALVLSPFKYFFKEFDDGAPVAQRLEATRGYGGNVTYRENATKTAATVGIQQFAGWNHYDVIHLTGHGAQVCDVNRCVATVLTGDIYSDAADLLQLTELGLNTAHVRGSEGKFLALGADYFRTQYPSGLDSKLIFFNACQTYSAANSELRDALLGPNSVFLGWTDVVESGAAKAAALAVFQDLSANGVTAQHAFDGLGDLAMNRHTFEAKQIEAELRLDSDTGGELRIREVVRLERITGGGELLDNGTVNVVGTANDGVVDLVPYQVLVEGISESQQEAAVIQFTVDGYSSTPQTVSAGERVGDTGWRLSGQIPYKDVAPDQRVEMLATVQLPEGGTSSHRVSVNLTAGSEPEAETWVGEGIYHLDVDTGDHEVHVTVVATVTFQQDPATIGARYKYLDSVGGTMTWIRSGSVPTAFDGPCAYSAGPVEIPIPDGDGQIVIDTAASPSTYSMAGLTRGPEIRIAENCGNYAFSTRVSGSWAAAISPSDGFTVSADGGTISGSTSSNTSSHEWTFRRQ
ncbi:MAG TPA: hypothetical protein VFS56_01880 [Gemmatimonadaceae bacterium]|nr:hypothetical protein [Gemmatimonadaceae bacterium]